MFTPIWSGPLPPHFWPRGHGFRPFLSGVVSVLRPLRLCRAQPLVPHITRRVAAQRSRFVVLGENPFWLEKEHEEQDFIKVIEIDPDPENIAKLRIELRQCRVTESVIFPDL